MVSPSCSTVQYFQVSTQSFNFMDKSNSSNSQQWHTLCYRFNRALLLAQYYARSSPNLNQSNHTHFSGAAHERFDQATMLFTADQRHKDGSHAATPDRHRSGTSSYNDAISNRMWRRRRGIDATDRSHRVSRMESGSRPFSLHLFGPLWPAITRSTG
jgi:hypothetical protein